VWIMPPPLRHCACSKFLYGSACSKFLYGSASEPAAPWKLEQGAWGLICLVERRVQTPVIVCLSRRQNKRLQDTPTCLHGSQVLSARHHDMQQEQWVTEGMLDRVRFQTGSRCVTHDFGILMALVSGALGPAA
jgi:hypothetical protein